MGDNDPHVIKDLMGPALNHASPQSNLAPAVLKLFKDVLLKDNAYIERVIRHYVMFRETVDKKSKKKRQVKKDALVKSNNLPIFVIPAKAGIQ